MKGDPILDWGTSGSNMQKEGTEDSDVKMGASHVTGGTLI